MTMHEATEPSCAARGLLEGDGRVRLVTRNLSLTAEGQMSVVPDARHPSALDLLVLSLVADLLAGLRREAIRAGTRLDDAELSVAASLDNPLVALGVVGETGSPALASVRGSLYVRCDATPQALEALWRATLERSIVYATLRLCADIHIDLKSVS